MPVTPVRAITLALLSAVALALLIHVGLATIDAAPGIPYVLFGLAKTQSGTPVPSGTLIEARIGNVHYGQTGTGSQDTRAHSVTGGGLNYGSTATFQVCADDPATGAVEGGAAGDQIVFFVAGIQAEAQPSTLFQAGVAQRVDLTIPSLIAPTAIPASTSASACTVAGAPSAPTATPTVASTPTATATVTATPQATSTPTSTPTATATPTATPAPTPEPIPVVSVWGLAALGAVLAMLTILAVRREPGTTAD